MLKNRENDMRQFEGIFNLLSDGGGECLSAKVSMAAVEWVCLWDEYPFMKVEGPQESNKK